MHGALYKLHYLFSLMLLLASIYGDRFGFFLCGFNGCFLRWQFWWWDGSNTEVICDNAEWSFFIDSISFFRISVSFCNVSFLFFSVCFAADTSEGVFLLVLWLRGALKIELLNVIVLFVICKILFAEFKSQICVASSF